MENASKALIIAGAILIAILLISLGIIVMNSINAPMDEASKQADQQAVEMFNSKFTGYGGTNQKAASVKALLTAVGSAKKNRNVSLTGLNQASSISTGNTYDVDFTYDGNGYINSVNIQYET